MDFPKPNPRAMALLKRALAGDEAADAELTTLVNKALETADSDIIGDLPDESTPQSSSTDEAERGVV